MSPKILLVGQAPSASAGRQRAFDGLSGRRLAKHLALPWDRFFDLFETTNLLGRYPGKHGGKLPPREKGDRFPMRTARRNAAKIRRRFAEHHAVVFCGSRTARAFGVWQQFCSPFLLPGGAIGVVIPHPSGVNVLWNDLRVVGRVRRTITKLHGYVFEQVAA